MGLNSSSADPRKAPARARGFTLLELIVVITIMGVLVSIALPNYRNSVLQAREAVLRENLYRLRDLIDQYQSDKGKYPETLETLVTDGYVRKIPPDPVSGEPWVEVPPENDGAGGEVLTGVFDVHSASTQVGMNGVAYSEW
ncbi:MAG: prepilin-type N-terminal cleavage/methylation domain-containing protein [Vicinamibacteria bacterium]